MRGWGELQTAEDLAGKVQRDFKRLQSSPRNVDAAFDFFVTAFHLLDWVHPDTDPNYQTGRMALRTQEPLLDIAGHLCNGAKHFGAARWNQVERVSQRGAYWKPGYWSAAWWPLHWWPVPRLTIHLTATEAARLGRSELDVLSTAKKICEFWERHFRLTPLP
jgi:hypothetical protein